MNYKKIYSNIVTRAKKENRVKIKGDCYEQHHIVPDFMFIERKRQGPKGHLPGNPDSPNNIVLLTFREHYICHLLLSKILEKTKYRVQAFTSLMLMVSPPKKKSNISTKYLIQNRKNCYSSRKYENIRTKVKQILSEYHSGMMYMYDSKTKEYIGFYPTDHPNFLNGTWCHHSKGMKFSDERIKKAIAISTGEKNGNFSGISNELFKEEWIILSSKLGKQPSFSFFRKVFSQKYTKEFPKHLTKFRFNRGKDLYELVYNQYGYEKHPPQGKYCTKLNPKDYI